MQKSQLRILSSLVLSKTFDILISAKTTLPTLLTVVGAPLWMGSLVVPIRESGALLPQALMSRLLSSIKARHHFWSAGVFIQSLGAFILFVLLPSWGTWIAGYLVLMCLTVMSIARAMVSLTSKDILASHVKKGRRGRLSGLASSISGAMSIAFVLSLTVVKFDTVDDKLMILGIAASLCLLFSLSIMYSLKTYVELRQHNKEIEQQNVQNNSQANSLERPVKGANANSNSQLLPSAMGVTKSAHKFFKTLPQSFKRLIIARSLFTHSALVAPLFVLGVGVSSIESISGFIIGQASASLLASTLWGRLADKNAVLTMQIGALVSVIAIWGYLAVYLTLDNDIGKWQTIAAFFILSVGHCGVRLGRKTYSVDVHQNQTRTELIGHTNTAIGVVLLVLGGLYAVLSTVVSTSFIMVVMSVFLILGIAYSRCLRRP